MTTHKYTFRKPQSKWYVFHDFDPKDSVDVVVLDDNGDLIIAPIMVFNTGQITIEFHNPTAGECWVIKNSWEEVELRDMIEQIELERKQKKSS